MDNTFVRKPSGIEAFFIDLDECGCNMTFHFFLRLNKKPSLDQLNKAVDKVLKTHSRINMKLDHDLWYLSDYIPECSIIEVEGSDITSYKPNRLDFHKHTLALSVLHTTENDLWYLCFDFFHGVADGRSGVQFVYDFFDILNGREPCENDFLLSDREIVSIDKKVKRKKSKHVFTVLPACKPTDPTPKTKGEAKTFVIRSEACIKSVAAKLSTVIGQHFSKKSAKMIIPVDIRRYALDKTKALFGNLFVPIFIDVKRLSDLERTKTEIVECVKDKPILRTIAKNLGIYTKFKPAFRRSIINFFLPIVMSSKKFIYCALVSPIGVIDSERLVCDDIFVNDIDITIASFPFTAFTIISVQFKGHTNTTVSWDSGRVSQKAAEKLINRIDRCISDSVAPASC